MIYRIHQDRNYKTFSINNEDICEKLGDNTTFHMDRTPQTYSKQWKTIKLDFYSDKKDALLPDLAENNGRIYISDTAVPYLKSYIEKFGELLPIEHEEGKGFLFNCLSMAEQVDGLDKEKSVDDPYTGNSFISFHEDRLTHFFIFKTAFDSFHGIFCSKEFKSVIEKNDLKGIIFGIDLGNMFPPDEDILKPLSN